MTWHEVAGLAAVVSVVFVCASAAFVAADVMAGGWSRVALIFAALGVASSVFFRTAELRHRNELIRERRDRG